MSRERGLALVSVLWGVAILSLIAAAMLSASVTSAHLDRNAWNATRAGSAADEAVNQSILALLDGRIARQPRVDSTPFTMTFDDVPVRVWIQDESGRVNVNFAAKDQLQTLFVSAGLEREDAGALADRIIMMRAPAGSLGVVATFRSTDDLLAVPGMSRALLARIDPLITVFGQSAGINQRVAPRAVLRTLPGMDDDAIDKLLKQRDEIHASAVADTQNTSGSPLGTTNSAFFITAETRVATTHIVRTAVVRFTGDVTKPYLIEAWR
jgi:general secretion pathway protein K